MARYLMKFSKEGNLKYISHLDVLRMFQRAFKRAGIKLKYSQGFNPHAKMGFALPLSLGFESDAEYMEFETESQHDSGKLQEKMQNQMPDGIAVVACFALAETSKTATAAVLEYATYMAECSAAEEEREHLRSAVKPFMDQKKITSVKYSKKKKKNIESDIRPLIHSVTTVSTPEVLKLSVMLRTGSNGNLNPETLAEALCSFCEMSYDRTQWKYRRTEMYFTDGKHRMLPLSEFRG